MNVSFDTLTVSLGDRRYDIMIGSGVMKNAGAWLAEELKRKRAIIITDRQVAEHHLKSLEASFDAADILHDTLTVEPGETAKSFNTLAWLMERLLALKPDRQIVLVALGGGVIGDLTGFAASILLRGVDFIQIPTTLLAQVDSSVGGKTGINTARGKNLVGSFHQPRLVVADLSTLKTLPKRQWLAGYAEIVKYGLINDAPFFDGLETKGEKILAGDETLLRHAVLTSCRAKAAIVTADERESGVRALLNLGHTFGHALEAETGFSDALLHGEAVAIGMCLAFNLSVRLGFCPSNDAVRVEKHLRSIGLPTSPQAIRPTWNVNALINHMSQDKKARDGKLTFILARGIGKAFITHDVSIANISAMLAEYTAL